MPSPPGARRCRRAAAGGQGPHVHSALLAPGGEHLLVVDLGTDELRRYRIADDGLLEPDGVAHRPERLVSAVQNADLVTVLGHSDGSVQGPVVHRTAVRQPACVLPAR